MLPAEQLRPAIARRRAQWKKYQGRLDPARLVFIDETWVKTNMAPLSILAVDDDELVLHNTAAMLEELGHHVVTASGGSEALHRLRQMPQVDILVTDQLMPNMTGVQLAIAASDVVPGLPVLLVSGFAELKAQEAERFAFLHKPFNRAGLSQAIARTITPAKAASGSDSTASFIAGINGSELRILRD